MRGDPEFFRPSDRKTKSAAPIQVEMAGPGAGLNLLVELGVIAVRPMRKTRSRGSSGARGRVASVGLTRDGRDHLHTFTDLNDMLGQLARQQRLRPNWDAIRRELRFGDVAIKRFTRSAENQELLLQAFQESGWPDEIDDPLRPRAE